MRSLRQVTAEEMRIQACAARAPCCSRIFCAAHARSQPGV